MSIEQKDNPIKELSIGSIKANLRKRAGDISVAAWHRFTPNSRLTLETREDSSFLPRNDSLPINGEQFTYGNDQVLLELVRTGAIIEVLRHYDGDHQGSNQIYYPDEFLGEANDQDYRDLYTEACEKLAILHELSRKSGLDKLPTVEKVVRSTPFPARD